MKGLHVPSVGGTWRSVVLVLLAGIVLWRWWFLRTSGHWDFMTYYWAAKAQGMGLDPYSLDALSTVAGKRIVLPYLYPPAVLYFLRPFTWLSLDGAITVFITLKVVALLGLLWLWRDFLGPRETLPLVVVVVLGFSDTVFNDLFAGNVSTFEALALWTGFGCLKRGRLLAFVALVLLASFAKLVPLGFLVLVLLSAHRRRVLIFGGALGLALLSVLASFGGSWTRMIGYFKLVAAVDERGPTNSAFLSLFKDIEAWSQAKHHVPLLISPWPAYLALCVIIVGVTAFVVVRAARRRPADRDAVVDSIIAAVILYALLLPRFKDYSYVVALPAIVFVGRRIRNALPLLILLASLTPRNTLARYALNDFPLADLVGRYFNLFLVAVLWLGFIFYAWYRGNASPAALAEDLELHPTAGPPRAGSSGT